MIAVTASPGTAKVSIGIKAPPMQALLLLSLATIPSTAPSPKGWEGFLTIFSAVEYAMKEATGPPAPGRAPIKVPMAEYNKNKRRELL